MVEVEMIHILYAIASGFAALYAQQQRAWNKLCKLARIAKRTHPEESELEGL